MALWLELACPACDEARPLTLDDRAKLGAKNPVLCSNGHKYRRIEGLVHWIVRLSPFGSALLFCDTAIEGQVAFVGQAECEIRLPLTLRAAEVWARPSPRWRALRGDVDFASVLGRRLYLTLHVPRRLRNKRTAPPIVAAEYQVVGARRPSRTPGWRQVLGESLAAYEDGRTNVSVLLGNIGIETFYSALADPRLRRKGMPQGVIDELHQRVPLDTRLREGFARPLRLPSLSGAPFWKDWQQKARASRHSLAHQWVFDRQRGRRFATEEESYEALTLQLKSIFHMNPRAFDWLLRLEPQKATP